MTAKSRTWRIGHATSNVHVFGKVGKKGMRKPIKQVLQVDVL